MADYLKLYEMGNEPGRRAFLDRLFSFLEEKGTPINTMPVISKQPLDLYRLYVCVQEKGGMMEVSGLDTVIVLRKKDKMRGFAKPFD